MGAEHILSIRRKRWNVAIQHIYLAEKPTNVRKSKKLVSHIHSLVPSRKLSKSETVHIRLTQDEAELFTAISKKNQLMLRRAQRESYQVFMYEAPTEENLQAFQKFYNDFAKEKKIEQINKFHMETIKLLNHKRALLLSEVRSDCGETLCYRLDIVNNKKAMSYYVATCQPTTVSEHLKQPMRFANHFLLWHNLLYLKRLGYDLYDMGGLADVEAIRKFKLSFGGKVVDVYSGYIAQSKISALLLGVQKWRRQQSK